MKFFEEKNDFHLTIYLYSEPSSKTLNLKEIKGYLKQILGDIYVEVRKDFITHLLNSKDINEFSKMLAQCKVRDLSSPEFEMDLLPGEIRYEKKLIEHPDVKLSGILYDGGRLDVAFQSLISQEELDFNNIHIIFTNRLFGTFDEKDSRYHARVIICGYPSIISTTGIVEAPAKSKEFYYLKQKYLMLGMEIPHEIINEKFQGNFIEYDDPRLTEIMKGYVMQSVFYHLIYEPFCKEKNCRLYNAHWQKEVINAQLRDPEFCKKHEKILQDIRTREVKLKNQ
ncbi:MAG: hypothetical protein JSW06_11105 [Thermoplasmatales archaeon]|nr:MAG: hypothetical protein JSW06_11105 [Thermoplasmatales archaeon]